MARIDNKCMTVDWKWTKILPFFIVEWMAKKYGEKFYDDRVKANFVYPYTNVRLYFKETKK